MILVIVCGCSATIVPPPASRHPVSVAVTNYGRHSSLILPSRAGSGSTEYAFGDWNWFVAGRNTPCDGISALLASKHAALGRIHLPLDPDSPALASYLKAKVVVFEAPKDRVDALRARLDRRFETRPMQPVYNDKMRLWFVKDDEKYGMWHNCNHMTADWLRELGCELSGATWWSNYKLAPDE